MISWFSGSSGRLVFLFALIAIEASGWVYMWYAYTEVWWYASHWYLLHGLVLVLLYYLALIVCVRRLHDLGQSGLWALLIMIPVPPFWLLFLLPLGVFRGVAPAVKPARHSARHRREELADDGDSGLPPEPQLEPEPQPEPEAKSDDEEGQPEMAPAESPRRGSKADRIEPTF